MSKIDELKEEVNWLGRWLNVFVITAFALIGWLALNYKTAEDILFFGASFSVVLLFVAIFLINRSAIRKIREMRSIKK